MRNLLFNIDNDDNNPEKSSLNSINIKRQNIFSAIIFALLNNKNNTNNINSESDILRMKNGYLFFIFI